MKRRELNINEDLSSLNIVKLAVSEEFIALIINAPNAGSIHMWLKL